MSKKVFNPFIRHPLYHYFLSYGYLKDDHERFLDFGCGRGEFIGELKGKAKESYGLDVDREAISEAKRRYPHVRFSLGKVGEPLPYKDKFFDVVFVFHVLEHVDSEERAISEAFRVLKKGGMLFLASPYRGLFTWADTANLRYRFPVLHKILAEIFYGKNEYQRKFVEKKKDLLFGDSSINRNWHEHYKEKEIRDLLKDRFVVKEFIKFSLFQPFLLVLSNVWSFIFKRDNPVLNWLIWWDNQLHVGELSYNMFVVAKKK